MAVAGGSGKQDLKRKHQEIDKVEDTKENEGPIPIVKLEVS